MIKHNEIWSAIDKLAQIHGLSASGLAKKAGLSSTLFNPSKRTTNNRPRWPSTESIAAILTATNTPLTAFVALVSPQAERITRLPLLSLADAAGPLAFHATTGKLIHKTWDEIPLPASTDPDAFALEISGKAYEPIYGDGARLVLSPAEKPRRGDRVGVGTRNGEIHIQILGREGAQKVELLPFAAESTPLTLARKDLLWLHRIVWASQ